MRIALITRRFDNAGGGTERDLLISARILAEAGHDIAIYASEIRASSSEFPVRRVGTPSIGRTVPLVAFAMLSARRARAANADLVLSFARVIDADVLRSGGSAHSSYLSAARQWRGPLAARLMQLSAYHRAQLAIERAAFRSKRTRRCIAVSQVVRRDLMQTFKLAPESVRTIYNGVDLERFKPDSGAAARVAIRRRLGLPERGPVIVFVGSGYARKGLGFLLRAWPEIDPATTLLIVGNDRSMASYRNTAARLGISGRVVFAGPIESGGELYAAADGLALPSLFEPFGNVVLEAMACGLPVVCSANCGAAEIIPETMAPWVVHDPTNPHQIAERIRMLLDRRGPVLSQAARAAAERYTWTRYGSELLAMLKEV